MPKNKKSFTLVEIIIVLGIITILTALVITAINPAQLRRAARDSNRKKDLGLISAALEQYYADSNHYPVAATFSCLEGILQNTGAGACAGNGTIYLKDVAVGQHPTAPATIEYCYTRPDSQNFTLCSRMEADSTVMTGCGSAAGGIYSGRYCITNAY